MPELNPQVDQTQGAPENIVVPTSKPVPQFPKPGAVAVTDRQKAWSDLAAPIQTSDQLYRVVKPASAANNLDYEKKVGFFHALTKGLPNDPGILNEAYDPNYKPTFGESMAAGLTDFVRSGIEVAYEKTDTVKQAREAVELLRQYDPNLADQIEHDSIGKKLSDSQLFVKGAASVGELALTLLPFLKVGRVALAAGEAATLSKLGTAGKFIQGSKMLSRLYSSGVGGALYGGLYGLHEYDADWKEATKTAAMGGVFGAGLMGLGSVLAFTGKYTGNKALAGIGKGYDFAKNALAERLPAKLYSTVFSVESTMAKYYGDIGKNFIDMYKSASRAATKDLGTIQLSMIENGLLEPPAGMGKAFKGVEFVGNNADLMSRYNEVLRGKGVFSDPRVRAAAIQSDARLQYLDGLRKTYGATAQREGVVESLLDLDTYLPKHTPVVELSAKARKQLASATTQAEREAIYLANDEIAADMVKNSVFTEKAFPTMDEAFKAYYDYVDFVNGGGHTPTGDNAFLQKMVNDGQARTIEEAAGKVRSDMKFRKKTLTPLAGSLDFKREISLPWYDPNPSRVMPMYTFDASMRVEMAKKFGANDEVIHEMIGKLEKDLSKGGKAAENAAQFEDFVRVVTGQINRSPSLERASGFIRALQVPKLAFAQVINLGQSLNTLLASDFGATMHGLSAAFKYEGMRNAVESGVLLNNFIRQVFDYNSGGVKVADSLMKYSGFTYTEMFNRVVASQAADFWATKNVESLLRKYGLDTVTPEQQIGLKKLFAEKEAMQSEALMGGIKVQEELFDKFRQLFPSEDFTASAGNLGAAKKRLSVVERNASEKTATLQKAKGLLEKELLSESEPLTEQFTADLRATIDAMRSEIRASKGVNIGGAGSEEVAQRVFTKEEQDAAVDFATQMQRAKLEDIIARLETKFTETQALGTSARDVVTMRSEVVKKPESLGNYVARIHDEIKSLDAAILGIQNEAAEKTRLLQGAIDSYKIAENRATAKYPGAAQYDAFIAERKAQFHKPSFDEFLKSITETKKELYTREGKLGYLSKETENNPIYKNQTIKIADLGEGSMLNVAIEDIKNGDKAFSKELPHVRYVNGKYEIVDGRHRIAESLLQGKKEIQVNIEDITGTIKSQLTDFYSKATGNDIVARSGASSAGSAWDKMLKDNPREFWALKELGVDPEQIAARGYMTPEEKAIAAQTFVERTQFLSRPSDLPYFASTPTGKILFQFKTFAYQQARFITSEMKRDFARGTKISVFGYELPKYSRAFRNLFILSTVFPMTGEVLADVRSLITQEKRPTKALDRYISDIFSAGTYGMLYDFYRSAESGKLAEFALGATAGDATQYLQNIVKTIKQPDKGLEALTKQLLRQTGVGKVITNTVYPNKNPGQTTLDSLREWMGD